MKTSMATMIYSDDDVVPTNGKISSITTRNSDSDGNLMAPLYNARPLCRIHGRGNPNFCFACLQLLPAFSNGREDGWRKGLAKRSPGGLPSPLP